jgi:hypothetical protein
MRKIALFAAAATAAGSVFVAAPAAHAAGYCNGQIDYACTDRSDGNTFCTLWLNGCYVGL